MNFTNDSQSKNHRSDKNLQKVKQSSKEDEHPERTRGVGQAETTEARQMPSRSGQEHPKQSAYSHSFPMNIANLFNWYNSKSVSTQGVVPSAGSTASVSPIKSSGLEFFYKFIADEVTQEAAKVFESANIDEAQFLTLTREDVNELMPGLPNFQTRKKIMNLLMEKNVKSSGSNICVHPGKVQQLLHGNKDLRKDPLASGSAVKNIYQNLTDMEVDFQKCLGALQQQIQVVAELYHQTKREENHDLKQDKCIQTDFPTNIPDEHKNYEGFPAQPNHPPMQGLGNKIPAVNMLLKDCRNQDVPGHRNRSNLSFKYCHLIGGGE